MASVIGVLSANSNPSTSKKGPLKDGGYDLVAKGKEEFILELTRRMCLWDYFLAEAKGKEALGRP